MPADVRRPGLVTTICVINALTAALSLAMAGVLVRAHATMSEFQQRHAPLLEAFKDDPKMHTTLAKSEAVHTLVQPLMLTMAVGAVLFGGVLAVISVGLWRLRAWGRIAMLTIAWIWLAVSAAQVAADVYAVHAVFAAGSLEPTAPRPGGSLSILLFPALAIAALRSGFIRDAFAAAELRRAAPPAVTHTAEPSPAA